MRVLFISNDGSGFADHMTIAEGTSAEKLFAAQLEGGRPEDYLIRANRQPVPSDYVLRDGHRVTMTPSKILGVWSA